MAFMIKKKRYKFQVNLCLEELSEVTYSKAILFAKVRQLEGGHFSDVSKRMEVQNHRVQYNARFSFLCKMNASSSSGVLDSSKCRISIRMEGRAAGTSVNWASLTSTWRNTPGLDHPRRDTSCNLMISTIDWTTQFFKSL